MGFIADSGVVNSCLLIKTRSAILRGINIANGIPSASNNLYLSAYDLDLPHVRLLAQIWISEAELWGYPSALCLMAKSWRIINLNCTTGFKASCLVRTLCTREKAILAEMVSRAVVALVTAYEKVILAGNCRQSARLIVYRNMGDWDNILRWAACGRGGNGEWLERFWKFEPRWSGIVRRRLCRNGSSRCWPEARN